MSEHGGELLWELALGMLSESERVPVELHAAVCAPCAAALADARETLALVALDLPPVEPSPQLLARVLDGTQSRFAGVIGRAAQLFDLGREEMTRLLDSLSEAMWKPSGLPGVDLCHVAAGPRCAGADAGLVRLAPNATFPHHKHLGNELMLILDGEVFQDDGSRSYAADVIAKEAGTAHAYHVGPEGCVAAVLLYGGIEIGGKTYDVSHPR